MTRRLSLVPADPAMDPAPTVAQTVQRLQADARSLASEHVRSLEDALRNAARLAAEVARGGDPYPPGVRDLARRAEVEIAARADTIEAITFRMAS